MEFEASILMGAGASGSSRSHGFTVNERDNEMGGSKLEFSFREERFAS